MRTLCSLVLILLAGCAAPSGPYVRTFPVGDWRAAWFNDGPELVVAVTNPPGSPEADVEVRCAGAPAPWKLHLRSGEEVRGLGQVMMRYAWNDPCSVKVVR
jgi:hypothetical protein